MASLNIVSLPEHLDEVKLSLFNHLVNLIAFNETRLGSTVTNDQIKVNGYDIIRKDYKPGAVCVFIKEIQSIIEIDLILFFESRSCASRNY